MSAKPELEHVHIARSYLGLSEIGATNKHPTIDAWAKSLSGKWLIGQPWCGTFCAQVFKEAGLSAKVPKDFFRAKEWEKAGNKLDKPAYGCVVTFTRGGGGEGHVGFVVGKTKTGMLKVLGGNQSNAVTIQDFDPKRVTAYRWVSTGTLSIPVLVLPTTKPT